MSIIAGLAIAWTCSAFAADGETTSASTAGNSILDLLPHFASPAVAVRRTLSESGIEISAYYTADFLTSVSGGHETGGHSATMLELFADIAMDKLIGWRGLTVHASGYHNRGSSISVENLGSLSAASTLEGYPSTRLVELWLEQEFVGDVLTVRVGQISPDLEFMIAENGRMFLNSTFSWPTMAWDNIPVPFASSGIQVLVKPSESLSLTAGLMNGDPVGPCPDDLDPGQCNRHGLDFRVGDPGFSYAEASYSYAGKGHGLPGTIKFGGWYHVGEFEDQRRDENGDLLARSDGAPLLHLGNHGFHAVIEQKLYEPGSSEAPGEISLFARVAASPSHRNQIDFQADAGLLFTGLVPARPRDILGVALSYSRISHEAAAFDRDAREVVIRDYEAVLEISYAAVVLPGVTLQPDLQYFWHPGGHALDRAGKRAVGNALVLGLRTGLEY